MNENNNNFINGAHLVINIRKIIDMENELEEMIRENIIDILVDDNGLFHYQVSDEYFNRLIKLTKDITRKSSTFRDMCCDREIDTDIFDKFYNIKN